MLKKSFAAGCVAILTLAGCTREVYLQPVPCETDECPACPCYIGAEETCPETEMETVIQTYQVYDVPAPSVTYAPCETSGSRCRTVCRAVPKSTR